MTTTKKTTKRKPAQTKRTTAAKPKNQVLPGSVQINCEAEDVVVIGYKADIIRDVRTGEVVIINKSKDSWATVIDLSMMPMEKGKAVGDPTAV